MPTKRDTLTADSSHEMPGTPLAGTSFAAPLGPWAGYTFAGHTVYAATSAHQHIEIVDLPAFGDLGRAYRLDGRFMASLADAHICHECMVHPLLLAHGDAQRVLILGGGDGGSAREVLRHASVKEVVVAELDAQVPAAILQHMPTLPDGAFDDPRTTLVVGDARDLVEAAMAKGDRFDAVVFDLTEADGDAASLHDAPFFSNARSLLTPRGGIALQLGGPWLEGARVRRMLDALRSVFVHVLPMTAYVPLYGTQWALALASDTLGMRELGALASTPLPAPLQRLRHYSPLRHAVLFDIAPELRDVLGQG
ncbi:hypothetical protein [Pandoraea vervacti]|nr:hypothetical protein [Pandoraea vervacti]